VIRGGDRRVYGAEVRVAILMLVIAAGLAGCGSDIELQGASGAVRRAEVSMRDLGSVRLRTTMRSRVDGITTRARGHGAIDFRSGRVSVTMAGTSGDRDFEYETISEEHAIYTRVEREWSVVRAKRPGGPVRKRAVARRARSSGAARDSGLRQERRADPHRGGRRRDDDPLRR